MIKINCKINNKECCVLSVKHIITPKYNIIIMIISGSKL